MDLIEMHALSMSRKKSRNLQIRKAYEQIFNKEEISLEGCDYERHITTT